MQATFILRVNAITLIAAGIAFGLYGPLMMAFFAIPEMLAISADAYWQIAAFARMFGAALFGFGLLVLAVQHSFQDLTTASQKRILAALILGHLMGAFIAITEQSSIWWTPAGWVTTTVFAVFVLAYVYAILKLPANKPVEQSNPVD